MKDARKPDHINLNSLLRHLREGRFVISAPQFDFEWEPRDSSLEDDQVLRFRLSRAVGRKQCELFVR